MPAPEAGELQIPHVLCATIVPDPTTQGRLDGRRAVLLSPSIAVGLVAMWVSHLLTSSVALSWAAFLVTALLMFVGQIPEHDRC